MIICSCHNLNHHQLEDFLRKNPQTTQDQLCQKTKAGTDCGICLETLDEMLITLGKSNEKTNNKGKIKNSENNYWEQG